MYACDEALRTASAERRAPSTCSVRSCRRASGACGNRTSTSTRPDASAAGIAIRPVRTRGASAGYQIGRSSAAAGRAAANAAAVARTRTTGRKRERQGSWRFRRPHRVFEVEGRFAGKRGLVLGVANRRSIAWAIARRLAAEGAELAFTFQGERIEKGVRDLADSVSSPLVTECDVRSDDDLERVFGEVGEAFGGQLDLLVHSVAFAAAEDLEGRFTDTPRDRFWMALDVSAYSLVACARLA